MLFYILYDFQGQIRSGIIHGKYDSFNFQLGIQLFLNQTNRFQNLRQTL